MNKIDRKHLKIVLDQGGEDLELENESQPSFETSNRKAAKRRNLPKPSTKVSPPAEQPVPEEVSYFVPAHRMVSLCSRNVVLGMRRCTEGRRTGF